MAGARQRIDAFLRSRLFYWTIFALCLLPALVVGPRFYHVLTGTEPDALGADPVKEFLHAMGRDALGLLLCALAVTPIRRITGLNGIQRVRRMVGLWSFTYACAHLATYLVFQQLCYSFRTCQWRDIYKDFLTRQFTMVGLLAFVCLLVLALTSTNGWIRRLGRKWQTLHRLVYVAAIAGIVHYAWGQKSDIRQPLEWAAVLAVLLGIRIYYAAIKRRRRAPLPTS